MTQEQFENMTDEDFYNIYRYLNYYMENNSIYAYLGLDEEVPFPHNEAVAERRFNEEAPVGNLLTKMHTNSSDTCIRRALKIIYDSYSSGKHIIPGNFLIDGELLNNNQVIDFLRKCYTEGLLEELTIVGDNYTLDEETYNKISYFQNIHVTNTEKEHDNISLINKKYKLIQGANSKIEIENDLIIREDMSNEELKAIIGVLNENLIEDNLFNIDIRFYNPERTVDLIERLDRFGLNPKIGIKILGYTLTENSDTYQRLIPIAKKRSINVSYVCCHDLLGDYTKEPFLVENSYFSELEPGGKTDILTYIKILEFLESFEQKVEGIDSNIEKIMTAYQYLNDNYYYDPDAGDTKNYGDTRDVDKILDTDQIVCAGYANLLSIMCRRLGIPMFTYSAPGHKLSIARVQEKDKAGNIILDKICTFDSTNDSGYDQKDKITQNVERHDKKDSYTYFGLNPDSTLHQIDIDDTSYITLANALGIQKEDLIKYSELSYSSYPGSYHNTYTALSYMISMLHLMGYNFDYKTTDIFDLIAELQEKERIGEIPTDMIKQAARNIERRKHPEMSEEEFKNHMNSLESRINNSISLRDYIYDSTVPASIELNKSDDIINNGNRTIERVSTFRDGIPHHNHVDLDTIDMGPVYYQELDDLPTGEYEPEEIEEEIIDHHQVLYGPNPYISGEPIRAVTPQPDPPTRSEEPTRVVTPQPNRPSNVANTPQSYTINNLVSEPGNRGIIINGNVHIKGNVNITINNYGQNPSNLSAVTIAGTTIRKPKSKKKTEKQEDYNKRIENYYDEYLPQAIKETSTTYRLTKNQIIQDLPIDSLEEQVFNAKGMSDEEIEEARRRL